MRISESGVVGKMVWIILPFYLFTFLPLHAQFRLNTGDDSPLRKLQFAEMAITNLYVDSVDEKKLAEDAIRGMLDKLDPHSSYLTPKEVKSLNEPLSGTQLKLIQCYLPVVLSHSVMSESTIL